MDQWLRAAMKLSARMGEQGLRIEQLAREVVDLVCACARYFINLWDN